MSDTQECFVFRVTRNKYGQKSGDVPNLDGDVPDRYYGYHENEYLERFVFIYDYADVTGKLWLGDAGWDEASRY